jgi:hypothetical protein
MEFTCKQYPGLSVDDMVQFFVDHGILEYLPTEKDCRYLDRKFVVKVSFKPWTKCFFPKEALIFGYCQCYT